MFIYTFCLYMGGVERVNPLGKQNAVGMIVKFTLGRHVYVLEKIIIIAQ